MGREVRYLRMTLDRRLTCSSHIDQVRREASQRLGVLSPLLNKRNGLSIRNGLMLYRQLIRPMRYCACRVGRHATDSHLRRLQVVQSKCLHSIPGVLLYVRNLQLHEDLEVPYTLIAEHIRSLEFRL
jgi:hypothetical protein